MFYFKLRQKGGVHIMNKFIFTLILFLGFSFAATNQANKEDQYYASLNTDNGEVVIAAAGKKKEKSPLRKRYLKRKRKLRRPAQGK
mgnify:CR=1 FL=1